MHRVDPSTTVDLVLAVNDEQGLSDAAASWLAQPHPSWNVVLAAPEPTIPTVNAALTTAGIPEHRITTVATDPTDDPTAALAAAARAATAEHLLLMQTPAIGLTHDWLTRLIGYSNQPQIAAAGPVLLAPDGRIQQAGIAIPEGIPLHLLHGSARPGPLVGTGRRSTTSARSAACWPPAATPTRRSADSTRVRRPRADRLLPACRRHHHRIVIVPDARLRATGPDPATNDLPAIWRLRQPGPKPTTTTPTTTPTTEPTAATSSLSRFD